nr:GNAT family N-acetyltransferase [Deinobacterium chartae]
MRLEHASAERFRRLHNAAIAGCEGLLPLEAATVAQWYAAPDFDPRDWQVLTCGEHDLAYVSMGLEETEQGQAGHVYMLGVAPQWHGQGIGLSLLARACALLRDRGALEVLLGAEFCSPEALALYHEIGFVTRYAAVRYRLQQPTATLEI